MPLQSKNWLMQQWHEEYSGNHLLRIHFCDFFGLSYVQFSAKLSTRLIQNLSNLTF